MGGFLGFLIMYIMFCIIAGRKAYDRGLSYKGRKEAEEEGKVVYIDGKGMYRSTQTKERVENYLKNGCYFTYTVNNFKIIKDYNEEEKQKINKELKEKGMKGRCGIVWFEVGGKTKSWTPYGCGNIWISIENETNRPYILEKWDKDYSKPKGWYKYYFINDLVGIMSGTSKYGRKTYEYYFPCNVDKGSAQPLSEELASLYILPKVRLLDHPWCLYEVNTNWVYWIK